MFPFIHRGRLLFYWLFWGGQQVLLKIRLKISNFVWKNVSNRLEIIYLILDELFLVLIIRLERWCCALTFCVILLWLSTLFFFYTFTLVKPTKHNISLLNLFSRSIDGDFASSSAHSTDIETKKQDNIWAIPPHIKGNFTEKHMQNLYGWMYAKKYFVNYKQIFTHIIKY